MIARHIRPENIARYSEGDLSDRRAARISSHLAGCARCAGVRDDLARVPALLASTQTPPMPDHLAARIQTALTAESARRASAADGTARGKPARGKPARGRASWSRPPARRPAGAPRISGRAAGWAAAAAAVVVAIGGGSYLISQDQGGLSSSQSAGAGAVPGPSRTNGLEPARAAGPQVPYQHAGKAASFTPLASRENIVPGKLKSQVQAMLADYRKSASQPASGTSLSTPGVNPDTTGGTFRIGGFSVSALAGCVSRIVRGGLVVLVETVSYQSSPAAVIIAAASKQSPEQVWVVGRGCSASASDVLDRATLPAGG
jgi:Putative zinc-finger